MTGPDVSMILLIILGGAVALGAVIALLVVSVKITGGIIAAIFWLVKHIVRFVFDVVRDVIRFVSAVIATLIAIPMAVFNVILARWPSAERWGRALKREVGIAGYSIYALALRRPLQLLCLDGVLDGMEKRLPQVDGETNSADGRSRGLFSGFKAVRDAKGKRSERDPAAFEGYDIEGTLRPGGSGAKLYVAAPNSEQRRRLAGQPDKVVIKSFALEEGSSLPQIVRESRALDSARAMGLVLDHGLDESRFWYAMPYHPGDNLAETTRLLHARSGPDGLAGEDLREGISYASDLVATLVRYHEGGLWHKDVKPDNIIVYDGRAHLVDLGLVTPLRSAMTLTTHGTEYFRDPEMVRQALRGVQVHQVDGAKFDVYGAGAVLYFLLENTFPAHGGLSSFARKSPDALRWIVRRAMADYHQRYASARALLDDLNAVVRSSDPWALRPVDLPSMRGADVEPAAPPAMGAAAWMPPPSANAYAPAGGAAVMAASLAGRPKLKVTSWWTGAYASPDVADRMRDAASAAKAARQAVGERKPRKVRTAPPSPSRIGSAIGLAIPIFFIAIFWAYNGPKWGPRWFGSSSGSSESAMLSDDSIVRRALPPATLTAPAQGTKMLVLNDHPGRGSPEVDGIVNRIAGKWTERGFALVSDDTETMAKVELALAKLKSEVPSAQSDFEAALAAGGYWAALKVDAEEGEGPSKNRLRLQPLGENVTKAIVAATPAKPEKKSRNASRRPRGESKAPDVQRVSLPEAPAPAEPPLPPQAPLPPGPQEPSPSAQSSVPIGAIH